MKFSFGKIFLLGFGFFGVSVIWGVYNAFVPLFLSRRFDLAPGLIGLFMTFDNIAALLIQPPAGALSDRLRTPIGRRLPFILIGAPISALAFGLIPVAAILPLFVACTSTLMLSMALWRTPVVALMPDITPPEYRSQANGIINLMGGVGIYFATQFGARLYERNPAFPFWMGSLLVFAAAALVLLFVKEPKKAFSSAQQPSMLSGLKLLSQEHDYSGLRLLSAIFFCFLGYSAVEAFFTLYAVNHLGVSEANAARLLSQLSLVFVVYSIPAGYLGGRVGQRTTIVTGIILLCLILVTIFLFPIEMLNMVLTTLPLVGVVPVIGALLMVVGAAWAMININTMPMVVNLSDPVHIGALTGLYYLSSTLASIVGPNLNGWIVQFSGKNYNSIMIVASFFFIAAFVLMLGVQRGDATTDDLVGDIMEELEELITD